MTNKNIKLTVATVAGATALFASKGVLADEAKQLIVEPTTTPVVDTTPTAETTPAAVTSTATTESTAETTSSVSLTSETPTVVTASAPTATTATESASKPAFTPATSEATPIIGKHTEPTTVEKTGTEITVTNPDVTMEFPNGYGVYAQSTVKYHVDFPDTIAINDKDTVTITLPKEMMLPTHYKFDVSNPEGAIIGQAIADSAKNSIVTTFNDYFKNHPLKKSMNLELSVKWTGYIKPDTETAVSFDGTIINYHSDKLKSEVDPTRAITKWGHQDKADPTVINWVLQLNYGNLWSHQVLTDYQLLDTLGPNQKLIENSISAESATSVDPFVSTGDAMQYLKDLKTTPTSLSFKIAKLDRMIYVYYKTKLTQAESESYNPTNHVDLTYKNPAEKRQEYNTRVALVNGKGDARGENLPTPAIVNLEFTKALAGRDLKADEFTFELKDESGKVLGTAKNTLDGKIKFGSLTFNQAGTFNYLVSEVKGTDTDIAYDPMVAKVTITVDKNGNVFKANTVLPNDTEFNNAVKQTEGTSAQFAFTKALAGRKLKDGEFTFVLKDEQGNVLQTVKNTVNGQVPFAALNYDKDGTYTYTVEEVPSTLVGVTSDPMKAKVVVTVTKQIGEKTNKLVAKTDLPEDTEFNNTFVLPKPTAVDVAFNLNKKFVNGSLKDGQFAFQLKDKGGKLVQTKANDKDGKISFDKVTFTEPGEFDYFITELTHNDEIDYDTKVVKAHVIVKYKLNADNEPELVNGRPVLLTDVIYSDNNTITGDDTTFTNTLATPAQTVLKFNKQLSGRELKDGEFTFVLKDAEGKELQTATNDKDGNITFKPLSFDKLGTYTYTVSEVNSHDEDTIYDTMVANVRVTVIRDGKVLVTQVDLPKDTTFNNANKDTTPAVAEIVFTKALSGRELKAGEFKFDLMDAWGNVVETISNDAKGIIKFSPIVYKQAGTYKYTVREQKGPDTTIVYDPMVADITINVTKTIGETLNAFVATAVLPLDTEFNNTYLSPQPPHDTPKPKTPVTETPKNSKTETPKGEKTETVSVVETPKGVKVLPHTGDSKSALGMIGTVFIALAGLAGYKRKQN